MIFCASPLLLLFVHHFLLSCPSCKLANQPTHLPTYPTLPFLLTYLPIYLNTLEYPTLIF